MIEPGLFDEEGFGCKGGGGSKGDMEGWPGGMQRAGGDSRVCSGYIHTVTCHMLGTKSASV